MPDRISKYRQVRLIVNVPESGHRYGWSLHLLHVKRGIPDTAVMDSGTYYAVQDPGTPEALEEAVAGVAAAVARRWAMVDDPQ